MIRSVRRKSRARRASPASIGLAPPTGAASICWRAMRSMKTARNAASCDAPAGGEQAVVREQHRVLRAEAGGDQLAFAVGGRQAGPVGQEGDVVEQRRRVHVGDDERLLGGGERRSRRRMGVDDRLHVGARAVDPEVKARRRIRLADPVRAVAREHVHGVVDEKPRRSPRPRRRRGRAAASRTCPRSGPRAVSWPASPDSWPSSARIQASGSAVRVAAAAPGRAAACHLAARGDLLQLLVELGIDLRAVDALRVGRLDPVLHQRLGALAHVGDELGARLDDRHVGGLERLQPDACRRRPTTGRRAARALRPRPTRSRPGPAWTACSTCPRS